MGLATMFALIQPTPAPFAAIAAAGAAVAAGADVGAAGAAAGVAAGVTAAGAAAAAKRGTEVDNSTVPVMNFEATLIQCLANLAESAPIPTFQFTSYNSLNINNMPHPCYTAANIYNQSVQAAALVPVYGSIYAQDDSIVMTGVPNYTMETAYFAYGYYLSGVSNIARPVSSENAMLAAEPTWTHWSARV